jgi:hypothetical protein
MRAQAERQAAILVSNRAKSHRIPALAEVAQGSAIESACRLGSDRRCNPQRRSAR